jgi:hypothetical protein
MLGRTTVRGRNAAGRTIGAGTPVLASAVPSRSSCVRDGLVPEVDRAATPGPLAPLWHGMRRLGWPQSVNARKALVIAAAVTNLAIWTWDRRG